MHILVVGAGLMGLTASLKLIQNGHQVTLIEALSSACQKASYSSAGYMGLTTPHLMGEPADRLTRVGARRHSNEGLIYGSREALKYLSFVNELAKERRPERIERRRAVREAIAQNASLKLRQEAEHLQFDCQESAGSFVINPRDPGEHPVTLETVLPIEPSLYAAQNVERLLIQRSATWSSSYYARQLKDYLVSHGVTLLVHHPVKGLIRQDGRFVGVATEKGNVIGEAVVLANGLELLDLLPTEAAKHLILAPITRSVLNLKLAGEATQPRHSFEDNEGRVIAPLGDFVRLMGRWLLGHVDELKLDDEYKALWSMGIALLPEAADWSKGQYLAQSVLTTPDGLALAGATNCPGLYLHSAGGWHGADFSSVSSEVLAASIDQKPHPLSEAFNPCRFA